MGNPRETQRRRRRRTTDTRPASSARSSIGTGPDSLARRAGVAQAVRPGRLPLRQRPRPSHPSVCRQPHLHGPLERQGVCVAHVGPRPRRRRCRASPPCGLATSAPGRVCGKKDCAGGRATRAWHFGCARLALVHFYARRKKIFQVPKDGEGICGTVGHEFFSFYSEKHGCERDMGVLLEML